MRPVWTFSEFSLQSYSRFRERSFFQRCGKGEQMRCRLILLISEHPIQQGIRKGGGPYFWLRRGRGRGEDRMAYSKKWMVKCLCVCLSQKSLFLYSKDLVVPHVSRHIPYWKELVVSMFPDTFRIQRIWSFPCFQSHYVFKEFGRFHVSRHIPYSKNLVAFSVYRHIPYSRDLVFSPVSRHFPYSKMSRNSKTTKSFEIMIFSRDFVVSPVSRLDLLRCQKKGC